VCIREAGTPSTCALISRPSQFHKEVFAKKLSACAFDFKAMLLISRLLACALISRPSQFYKEVFVEKEVVGEVQN
jgi:hypothetical protein